MGFKQSLVFDKYDKYLYGFSINDLCFQIELFVLYEGNKFILLGSKKVFQML